MSSQENLIVMIKVSDRKYKEISQHIGDSKTRGLEFQCEFIIPKTQIFKAKSFKHRNGGDNRQYHSKNFEDILLVNASCTLKSSAIKINEYRLFKAKNDYKNFVEPYSEKVIIISSYDEVLIIFYYIMQNRKYCDANVNIVYFMHNDVLYHAGCSCDGGEWYCIVSSEYAHDLNVGDRIFSYVK